jgi:hypothetical protein
MELVRDTENRSAAQAGRTNGRQSRRFWLVGSICLHTAVYFGYPSTASLNGCHERPQAGSDRLQTIHHSGTITMSGIRGKGARAHTRSRTQKHTVARHSFFIRILLRLFRHIPATLKEQNISSLFAGTQAPRSTPLLERTPPNLGQIAEIDFKRQKRIINACKLVLLSIRHKNCYIKQTGSLQELRPAILCICGVTPRSTGLPEKLTGPQLRKQFSVLYGSRRFITEFTTALSLTRST